MLQCLRVGVECDFREPVVHLVLVGDCSDVCSVQVALLLVWLLSFLLGVHAPNKQLCVAYTALLLMHLPWPEPSWFYALWFAVNWPTFGPKGKAKASAAEKEAALRAEVVEFQRLHPGERPKSRSSLYEKLRRAGALHLLEAREAETEEQRRQHLKQEVEAYLAANDGRRPAWTSSLYVKLQKAGALDLLEKATVTQSPEERRESLEKEVEAYLAANDGRRPARTSSLYVKLQKAGALDFLEKATVAQSPEERRESLEKEVEAYLAANDGRRPARTASLYVKLQKRSFCRL